MDGEKKLLPQKLQIDLSFVSTRCVV